MGKIHIFIGIQLIVYNLYGFVQRFACSAYCLVDMSSPTQMSHGCIHLLQHEQSGFPAFPALHNSHTQSVQWGGA